MKKEFLLLLITLAGVISTGVVWGLFASQATGISTIITSAGTTWLILAAFLQQHEWRVKRSLARNLVVIFTTMASILVAGVMIHLPETQSTGYIPGSILFFVWMLLS